MIMDIDLVVGFTIVFGVLSTFALPIALYWATVP